MTSLITLVPSPSDIIECVNAVTRSTARVQDESNQTEAIQMLSPVSLPTNTMKETFVTAQKADPSLLKYFNLIGQKPKVTKNAKWHFAVKKCRSSLRIIPEVTTPQSKLFCQLIIVGKPYTLPTIYLLQGIWHTLRPDQDYYYSFIGPNTRGDTTTEQLNSATFVHVANMASYCPILLAIDKNSTCCQHGVLLSNSISYRQKLYMLPTWRLTVQF